MAFIGSPLLLGVLAEGLRWCGQSSGPDAWGNGLAGWALGYPHSSVAANPHDELFVESTAVADTSGRVQERETGKVRIGKQTTRWVTGVLLTALGLGVLTGCGTDVDDIGVGAGHGWSGVEHDGRNSGTSPISGTPDLSLSWSRPVGGPLAQGVSVGPEGQLFLTTRVADNGCNIFSFQLPTGRKRFCNPMGPHAISAPTVVDAQSNVYVGDDDAVTSFNYLGQPRWRTPVAGVPTTVQFTGDSHLLTITQRGQIEVLSRQTGKPLAATHYLLGAPELVTSPQDVAPDAGADLADCATGGPDCAVATLAAIDQDSGRFFVTLRRPGAPDASLVALRYHDGKIQPQWQADFLTGGSSTNPTLSADGSTVYVGDNSKRVIAVNAEDGSTRWVHQLDWVPTALSVTTDGLLIPAGRDAYLLALRDSGDSVEPLWERKDLPLRGVAALTENTGYIPVAIGGGLSLITFATDTGKTLGANELPGAQGETTGTAIAANGAVITATRIGEVFVFAPRD